jgi:tetratricopeptide (TPR) repeat protein
VGKRFHIRRIAKMRPSADLQRRSFLIRSGRWVSAALLGPRAGRAAQFHPHYRTPPPLEELALKIDANLDDFPAEKQHDRVAAILAQWRTDLLESPGNFRAIAKVLSPDFRGVSLSTAESKRARSGATLSVRRMTFPSEAALSPSAFLQDLQVAFGGFEKLITAELQITRIEGDFTRVRYEMVGAGKNFHREQRVGFWDLKWRDGQLLSWKADDETRSQSAAPVFEDITATAFGNNASYSAQFLYGVDHWRTVLDGACGIDIYGHNGVSVGDIDNDGFDDLYICQPAGLPNRLYRNRGDGTFDDITEASGVGLLDNTACALFADFDNDGRQDLVVVRASGPLLFLNQGNNTFRLKPDAFHFAAAPQGTFTGAAVADYNRDGWLDIYFCLYVYYQGTGQYKYPTPYFDAENGPPNFLMHNNGDGTFRDVTAGTGLDKNNTRFSFCCGWSDYNRDGWPDLYVVNDFGRKNLYRNNGDGTFTDVAAQVGVEDVGAGMGISWFDYDNDGVEDLYVADMWTAAGERISTQPPFQRSAPEKVRALYRKHAMGNSLFHRDSHGGFADVTRSAGVGMGRWAWSTDAWDFDHDGFADLYIANGMLSGPLREDLNSFFWRQVVANSPGNAKPSYDYEQGWSAINELIRADHTWSGYERNVFYANNRDGTFSDVSGVVGLDFIEDSRAFALADFDHDGRQEVFLKNRNAPQLRVLKNTMEQLPPSIAFRLRGTKSNRDAIGAAITVAGQTRMLQAGSGFLSQHSKEVFFGLGETKGPVDATIRWPSGLVQHLQDLPINHRIQVEEGAEPTRLEPFKPKPAKPTPQPIHPIPTQIQTWLLIPIPLTNRDRQGAVTTISTDDNSDQSNIYNIIYRYLYDRHRDLSLPTSFLHNEKGEIVKIYQGPVTQSQIDSDRLQIPRTPSERLAKALPFPGISSHYEFGRNHLSLGSVFFQRGYLDQAEASFNQALLEDPSSAEAYYGLGSIQLQEDNLPSARVSFQKAATLDASYPDTRANAWNNLGLLATREGQIDEAIRCLQKALRLNPDHFIALENLGSAYRQQKRWDDARRTLEDALRLRPQDPEANYSLAMVYAQTDQPERAYDYLQIALKARPTYPEALNNLGVLYLRTHRRDQAVEKFEECIRVAPGFDQSYLNLARVYSVEGTADKARDVLRSLLKQHPDHVQAQEILKQLE